MVLVGERACNTSGIAEGRGLAAPSLPAVHTPTLFHYILHMFYTFFSLKEDKIPFEDILK